jgi:hypothetical protein
MSGAAEGNEVTEPSIEVWTPDTLFLLCFYLSLKP